MAPNLKQYESISSHNMENQTLIADETIEQGFSPRRRPLMTLFLGIALATIAAGSIMVHQTFGSYRLRLNAHKEHIAFLKEVTNDLTSKVENFASGQVMDDESDSRVLTGSLADGDQCFRNDSCSSGTCLNKPYAFCSGAPTASPTISPGSAGGGCLPNYVCNSGMYCGSVFKYDYDKGYGHDVNQCVYKKDNGLFCHGNYNCKSDNCVNTQCTSKPASDYVQKYANKWPNCSNISCFSDTKEKLKQECDQNTACSGFSYSAGIVDGGYGCLKNCGSDDSINGYGTGGYDYWEKN